VHPTCGPTQPDDIPGIVRYMDRRTHDTVMSQYILHLRRYNPPIQLYVTLLFLFLPPSTLPPFHVPNWAYLSYSLPPQSYPVQSHPYSISQIQDLRGAQGADQQPTHQLGLPPILHAHGRTKRYLLCFAV
jgi:hypothetical protein